jgi:LuxR family transcriptional regulator, quorum-sensing system regulator LasR
MHTPAFTDDTLSQWVSFKSETDIFNKLSSIAEDLEIDYFLFGCVFSLGNQSNITRIISNYPKKWRNKYDKEKFILVDPVMIYCTNRLVPIGWNCLEKLSINQSNFMEEARGYGLASGLSFPIHSREGDVGILSFSSNKPSKFDQSYTNAAAALMVYGHLLAGFVHDAMRQIVDKPADIMRSSLTPRELECLKWIAAGKSSWEISSILSISEHGVLYHVRNIMSKFDAPTRHLAVLKAVACGIV